MSYVSGGQLCKGPDGNSFERPSRGSDDGETVTYRCVCTPMGIRGEQANSAGEKKKKGSAADWMYRVRGAPKDPRPGLRISALEKPAVVEVDTCTG